MFLARLIMTRQDYIGSRYGAADPTKPFQTTIEVIGQHGKIELNLPPELSQKIVAIVAEEVAAAGRATAEMMTADAMTLVALPAA